MKSILSIALFLSVFGPGFGQSDTLAFRQFPDSIGTHTLHLYPDQTFVYSDRGSRSCWTWVAVFGEWTTQNDHLVLTDSVFWMEELFRFDTVVSHNPDYVVLTVKNRSGQALPNVEIHYSLNAPEELKTYFTDNDGKLLIPKSEIAKQQTGKADQKTASFGILYKSEVYGDSSMGISSIDLRHDKIDITVIEEPEEKYFVRTTRYKIEGGKLLFESQSVDHTGVPSHNWGNFQQSTR